MKTVKISIEELKTPDGNCFNPDNYTKPGFYIVDGSQFVTITGNPFMVNAIPYNEVFPLLNIQEEEKEEMLEEKKVVSEDFALKIAAMLNGEKYKEIK